MRIVSREQTKKANTVLRFLAEELLADSLKRRLQSVVSLDRIFLPAARNSIRDAEENSFQNRNNRRMKNLLPLRQSLIGQISAALQSVRAPFAADTEAQREQETFFAGITSQFRGGHLAAIVCKTHR